MATENGNSTGGRRSRALAHAPTRGRRTGSASTPTEPPQDLLTQFVVDRVNEKMAVKAARHADKMAEHTARHADTLHRLEHVARGALDLWMRDSPGSRKPRFSRDQIARAALHVADAEGIEALSMRRLAAELGAGTMTLYHYVHTKDELMALLLDEIMGEVVVDPSLLTDDWRASMTVVARSTYGSLQRHPWVFDIVDDPAIGPNGVRHFDQSLLAVSSLAISLSERLDIITAVDEYVFGHCLYERNNIDQFDDSQPDGMVEYVQELTATGDYPQISTLIDEFGAAELWRQVIEHGRDHSRFERNLNRLLDGIALDLNRRIPPG